MPTPALHDAELLTRIAAAVESMVREMRDAIDAAPPVDAAGWLSRPLNRAARLAERLRAAGQAQALAPATVVLMPRLCSLAHTLRLVLDQRLSVDVNVAPDCLDARVDPAALERALIELCVNGRDAMPDGGHLVLAARNGELPGGVPAVAVAVSDNGVGMTDQVLQGLVKPFFTTRTDRHAGLGLAAVRGFVWQSGGDLRISSSVGAGTTVTLLLPAA